MNQTILIVGLGLIGGSIASCIKKEHPNRFILGWDYNNESMIAAKNMSIIDEIPISFEIACCKADVIILAGPIHSTLAYMQQLDQLPLKQTVLVTDVGSTKFEIAKLGEQLSFDFIGGHPMAGSHKSGVLAANSFLFENAYFIFTPISEGSSRVSELKELYKGTRAKFIEITPKEHDQITGMLSHLPHIIAAGLVNQAEAFSFEHEEAKRLAAGGFRDITRIASSDPTMWTDILLSNREALIQLIDQWQGTTTTIKKHLINRNQSAIFDFFETAKRTRDEMPIHQKGAIPGFYDLLVDVPDYPGVIAEVTSLLAQANLSIVNLRILETREDIIGILQISFKNEEDLIAAKAFIEKKTTYLCRLK